MTKNLTNGLGIVLATAAFAAALPTVASAAFPGENGMIAMGCSTLRNAICVTEPGSRVTTYLTDSGQYEAMPSFSADGRRIVFARDVGRLPSRHTEIFVMRASGAQAERLTHSGPRVGNSHPSFTPDGSRIVFQRGGGRIMVMADDGSNVEELGAGGSPAVSPNGERVAFIRDDDPDGLGARHLYTMAIDGSDVDPVADSGDTWRANDPSWSPDSEQLVFTYYAGAPTFEHGIFAVPYTGGDPGQVGPEPPPGPGGDAAEPTFSPDATRVAFLTWCGDEGCPDALFASALDGAGLTRLGSASPGAYPDWGVRTPGDSSLSGRCNGRQATIVGSNRDDSIVGTSARDIISARRGSDLVKGLAGNDVICGGKGKDRIKGGGGTDRCLGGAGADRLLGCERRR